MGHQKALIVLDDIDDMSQLVCKSYCNAPAL